MPIFSVIAIVFYSLRIKGLEYFWGLILPTRFREDPILATAVWCRGAVDPTLGIRRGRPPWLVDVAKIRKLHLGETEPHWIARIFLSSRAQDPAAMGEGQAVTTCVASPLKADISDTAQNVADEGTCDGSGTRRAA